jgi:Sec7-like guanine-nucleotide exchange factor
LDGLKIDYLMNCLETYYTLTFVLNDMFVKEKKSKLRLILLWCLKTTILAINEENYNLILIDSVMNICSIKWSNPI